MAVIIGSARSDERGKLSGGKAGDQTGKEVCTRSYYIHSKGWYAFRPKSIAVANAIAEAMKQAVDNPYIGYDQNERLGTMTALKKYGSLKKIAEPVECDCSALVRACIYQATNIDVGNFRTINEPTILANSGLFEDKISVKSSTVLYNGDILVTKTKGHTVVVVSGNPRVAKPTSINKIDTVKEVQNWANTNYKFKLVVDGDYGSKTKAALVKILQTELNNICNSKLSVDGVFGKKTKSACPVLKNGTKNDIVSVLQALLICNGVDNVCIDGNYGSDTTSAVKAYQKKNRLLADGKAGKNTFAKLCI
jgi:peptidoglycan hydrolase-like protein with peptidoglycan-binding domain